MAYSFIDRQNVSAPKGPSSVAQEYKREHVCHMFNAQPALSNDYFDVAMNVYSIIAGILSVYNKSRVAQD